MKSDEPHVHSSFKVVFHCQRTFKRHDVKNVRKSDVGIAHVTARPHRILFRLRSDIDRNKTNDGGSRKNIE